METGNEMPKVCQCCGMPLDSENMSREKDGSINESYCKWCYVDGEFTYRDMNALIEYCAAHFANENFTADQMRAYMREMLPKLDYWKDRK